MLKLDEYMAIKEAAEYLGVCTNTLRNWGATGKIKELRNPMNGYRLFKQQDLAAILRQVQQSNNAKLMRKPR